MPKRVRSYNRYPPMYRMSAYDYLALAIISGIGALLTYAIYLLVHGVKGR